MLDAKGSISNILARSILSHLARYGDEVLFATLLETGEFLPGYVKLLLETRGVDVSSKATNGRSSSHRLSVMVAVQTLSFYFWRGRSIYIQKMTTVALL